jgi:hypothetical protein
MITSHQLTAPPQRGLTRAVVTPSRDGLIVALCLVGAALLVVSGLIHLHLWHGPYRHLTLGHMNTLFVIQWVLCFVGAAALLVMRNLLAVLAAAGLMAGTFIGYLISRYHTGGLFGFYLGSHYSSSDATWALRVEITGTVLMLITAGLIVMRNGRRTR